jgi:hypothetical protein
MISLPPGQSGRDADLRLLGLEDQHVPTHIAHNGPDMGSIAWRNSVDGTADFFAVNAKHDPVLRTLCCALERSEQFLLLRRRQGLAEQVGLPALA